MLEHLVKKLSQRRTQGERPIRRSRVSSRSKHQRSKIPNFPLLLTNTNVGAPLQTTPMPYHPFLLTVSHGEQVNERGSSEAWLGPPWRKRVFYFYSVIYHHSAPYFTLPETTARPRIVKKLLTPTQTVQPGSTHLTSHSAEWNRSGTNILFLTAGPRSILFRAHWTGGCERSSEAWFCWRARSLSLPLFCFLSRTLLSWRKEVESF